MNTSIFFKTAATISLSVLSLLTVLSPARATILYDESPSGDLSNVRLSPTTLGNLTLGDNILKFTINNPGTLAELGTNRKNRDLEYFTLTVPEGFVLSRLVLDSYTPEAIGGGVFSSDQISFIGLQAGTQFTERAQPSEPDGTNSPFPDPTKLLGFTLFGTTFAASSAYPGSVQSPVNDLLPAIGSKVQYNPLFPGGTPPIYPSPIGFTSPLAAGNYVFWVQQTAIGAAQIQMNFELSSIPEPSSILALLTIGGLGVVSRIKRR